jgi:hypothetical protein
MKSADISGIKKREYLEYKINELAMIGRNKNTRDLYKGINEFKRGCQPRNNLVKDGNGNILADSHSILSRWKNYVSDLLNVFNAGDLRQTDVRTAEPLLPGSTCLEVETDIAKLLKYKSPGSDQISAKLIQPQIH